MTKISILAHKKMIDRIDVEAAKKKACAETLGNNCGRDASPPFLGYSQVNS
jgi:hypothetical protein